MPTFEDALRELGENNVDTAIGILENIANERGNPHAAHAACKLGEIFYGGLGGHTDHGHAAHWYKISAEQGYAEGQYHFGAMYGLGKGVPQNFVLAHMWFNLAYSNGFEQAENAKNKVAKVMTPEQIERAQDMAVEAVKPRPRAGIL